MGKARDRARTRPETPTVGAGAGMRATVALSLLTLGSYIALVAGTAALPGVMSGRPFGGPFSLAMILGAAQMLVILLATAAYILAANRRQSMRDAT